MLVNCEGHAMRSYMSQPLLFISLHFLHYCVPTTLTFCLFLSGPHLFPPLYLGLTGLLCPCTFPQQAIVHSQVSLQMPLPAYSTCSCHPYLPKPRFCVSWVPLLQCQKESLGFLHARRAWLLNQTPSFCSIFLIVFSTSLHNLVDWLCTTYISLCWKCKPWAGEVTQ